MGFIIGKRQIRPLLEKITTLETAPRPTTKKQLQRFLGLVGYYSRFVPNFATISSLLTDLLKGRHPYTLRWDENSVRTFECLRQCLSSQPTLHNPDFSRPFLLQTDASEMGIGVILAQEVNSHERPVLFISRKLQPPERNYPTVEKEALAVRWAVGSLQYYLSNNLFTLVVDHASLLWMS